jgi:hypothetical protein
MMDLEEFIETIRGEVERDIDQQISAERDPETRALLGRHRSMLVSKALDANRIANLKHKLEMAEERLTRLEPQLVDGSEV